MLSEILDSLSTGATRTGSLRSSKSLDCCHRGDLDSCLNLVRPPVLPNLPITCQPIPHLKSHNLLISPPPTQSNMPGRPIWQPDEEDPPETQPQSLPASMPCLQTLQPSDTKSSSKNLPPKPPSEASQEITSPSQTSTATDPIYRGAPESSLKEPYHRIQHLSPPHEAAGDSRAQESPCSQLSTASTQPSPPESQLQVPTKPNLDITWTSQPLDSSSDPGSPKNPRAQPSEGLLAEHVHLQPPKGPEAPRSPAAPVSNQQEPQARSQPRVAELKKCFEG